MFKIIGAHLAGTSVTRTASLCGVSRATVARVMSAYYHKGPTTSNRSNCRRKRKLSERDVRVLTQMVSKKHKTTAAQLTADLSPCTSAPPKTVFWELHRVNIHGWAAIAKPFVTRENKGKHWFKWKQRKSWAVDKVAHVLFSDESTFTVFRTSGRVTMCRSPKEAYHPDCCVPQSEARGWTSDGPGCNIMAFPRPTI